MRVQPSAAESQPEMGMLTPEQKKARAAGPAEYRQAAALERIADTLEEDLIPTLRKIHDALQIFHKR